MKAVSVRDLQKSVRECVDSAQRERVVVTRRGKPAAVIVGVEGKDWETVVLETSHAFWDLIEKRRKQKTVSLAEMRRRLASKTTVRAKGRARGRGEFRRHGAGQ